MAKTSKPEVSDQAVTEKTGRSWDEWFHSLDKAGAKTWDHKKIVQYLKKNYALSGWWQQTVTVGYERARGKRAVHETKSGFVCSKSKTIEAPVGDVFVLWTDGRKRKRWLVEDISFSTKTENKTLRFAWGSGGERIAVGFVAKSKTKTVVTVQHTRLRNETAVKKMKAFWTERLTALTECAV